MTPHDAWDDATTETNMSHLSKISNMTNYRYIKGMSLYVLIDMEKKLRAIKNQ